MKSIKVNQLPTAVIVGCCCSALVCSYTLKKFQSWKRKQELLAKIQRKQKERQNVLDSLRDSHPFLPELMAITELSLEALLEKLQIREVSATQVLRAYVSKALRVTDDYNCITEFIPWAENLAEELDRLPSPKGPLHGLPIAIKDDHNVKGLDSTIGFAKNLYHPAEKNCVPVQILIDLGAVPFCKTNVPQALASINSDNPVFGTTYNALDKTASPGGSSGGSGCVVSSGAAPVATGSDIAGSLRIPAHFHGLCSLRSTNGRLSCEGMKGNLKHVITLSAVTGFITKDVKSQVKLYKLITEDGRQNRYDPSIVPLPWNEQLFTSSKPLKIGYYTSLPIFPASGDTPATVLKAKLALESLNYEVVEFALPDTFDLSRSLFGLYWCDLGKNLLKEFDGEPLSKSATGIVAHASCPVWMRNLLSTFFSIKGLPTYSTRTSELFKLGMGCQQVDGFTESVNHLRKLRSEVLSRMKEEGIDLLLGPVMPFPSIEESVAHLFSLSVIYTFIWNVLDMPAGVVRFGTETGKLFEEINTENDYFLKMVKKAVPSAVGFPINVQVIGKPFQEELVLRGLSELENYHESHIHSRSKQTTNGSSQIKLTNGSSRNGIASPFNKS